MYQEHKQLETNHKKLGSDYDWQQDKLQEARMELKEKTKVLADQGWIMAKTTIKVLEEAVKEQMKLISLDYQEVERSNMVLDMVETTYHTKLLEYEMHAKVMENLIK